MASPRPDDHDMVGWARLYAGRLNRRSWRWPWASPFYEVMSGGLMWPDERLWLAPTPVAWALRPLFAHRTWLALPGRHRAALEAEGFEPFHTYWELCRGLFPRWVGFHPARARWGRREVAVYRAGAIGLIRCLQELEAEDGSAAQQREPHSPAEPGAAADGPRL